MKYLYAQISTVQSDSLDQCLYFPPRPAYQQNPCLSVDALENLSRGSLVNFSRILPIEINDRIEKNEKWLKHIYTIRGGEELADPLTWCPASVCNILPAVSMVC